MPRVKRRTKRRETGYTGARIAQLLTGRDFFGDAFGRNRFGQTADFVAMQTAWEALRDELLPPWLEENPDIAEREAYKLHFGKPASLMTRDDFDAEYEGETEFPDRWGLLTEAERAALGDSLAT